MKRESHYETVSVAIEELRKRGYAVDFNLPENREIFKTDKYKTDNYEIVNIYRYEGNSDPADEASVYAIESKTGVKGILVAGFGISTDQVTEDLLAKLPIKQNNIPDIKS